MTEATKRCPKCSQIKPVTEFNASNSRRMGGTQAYCKPCMALMRRDWYSRHRDEHLASRRARYEATKDEERAKAKARRRNNPESAAQANRKWYLRKKYGLTPEQYDAMVAEREGRCDICKRHPQIPRGKKLALYVDHCHVNGHVRGLLCAPCNTAIGNLGDDVARMYAAIRYVEANRA